ncbi:ABC transporter permease YtrF precursor [Corynebacterium kalinowskii]|uniref:ABC transporter permease YtrF n=1 Tax=Corynebacterium kalinowskii TaxID=2675216 RepID=A0A6B8VU53_9CORY|nr:FtsX-like permease family protein [Corynebacterium kalinowskii]QGU03167.1 ABC transporter permease YtrF precursor [Corynebacterium kalinowskii]
MKNAMRTISLRNLSAHKLRLALTLLAVILGTAFIAGSNMLSASMNNAFTDITTSTYESIDLQASPKDKMSLGIPLSVRDELRANPDIVAVDVEGLNPSIVVAGPDGKALQSGGAPSLALSQAPDGSTVGNITTLTEGSIPTEPGTAAINSGAAEKAGIKLGDDITMVSATSRDTYRVVGIYDTDMEVGGFVGLVIPESDYLKSFTDGQHLSGMPIDVKGDVAAAQATLEAKYPDLKFETGTALAEKANKEIKDSLAFMNYFLWAFAAIALLVGSFIISNTFSMIISQRLKEFALLRSLGASRSQITTAVVFEAAIVGLIGSALGILAGMGITKAIYAVMEAQDLGMPDAGLSLDTASIVAPIVVGVLVTVFSAWAPARRAGRVHPVQAMRSGDQSSSNSLTVRTIIGAVFMLAGAAAALYAGLNSDMGDTKTRAITVGVATFAVILGLWLAGPALSIPIVGSIGRVVGLPFGNVGKLASTNSRRNPRRTAATAFALTLGLTMVSAIGMMGATMRDNVDDLIDTTFTADYMLRAPATMGMPIPLTVPERVTHIDGVEAATALYLAPVTINKPPATAFNDMIGAIEGDPAKAMTLDMESGDSNLEGREGAILDSNLATEHGVQVGDTITLFSFSGEQTQAPVTGIFKPNPSIGTAILSMESVSRIVPEQRLRLLNVIIDAKDGADLQQLRTDLEDEVSGDLTVMVLDREDVKGEVGKQITMMLNILYALLALSVIIAVLGIMNTLALSVSERRQEIGMLRAVGMQRSQVSRMIHLEAIVIALYGAVVGSLIGLGLGWAFIKSLSDMGLTTISVPWLQVGVVVLASGLVGLIAALMPARGAARTQPLEAIEE